MASGKGGSDTLGEGVVYLILFMFFVVAYFLYTHQYLLVGVWRDIRIIELYPLSWLPGWLPLVQHQKIMRVLAYLQTHGSKTINHQYIPLIDDYFARRFSWILGLILVVFGVKKIIKQEKVSSSYDMETLLKRNVPLFPMMGDACRYHPEKMDIELDPEDRDSRRFAPPMTPKEFALLKPPLGLRERASEDALFNRAIWDGGNDIDWDLAERAFAAQLGSHYKGPESLSEDERFVYHKLLPQIELPDSEMIPLVDQSVEIALARHLKIPLNEKQEELATESNRPTKELLSYVSNEVLSKIGTKVRKNRRAMTDGDNPTSVKDVKNLLFRNSVIKAMGRTDEAKNIGKRILAEALMERHGFTRVGLMSLLEEARKSGVISSGEFDSIKADDRTLWHCLDCVGRKTAHAEAAGPYAHWGVEKRLHRPLSRPEVYMAVEGLVKAIGLGR